MSLMPKPDTVEFGLTIEGVAPLSCCITAPRDDRDPLTDHGNGD